MLLSVIIVSYNVKYFLEQCLCSLHAALTNIDAEVLIVDNCSEDGSIGYLQPRFPKFTFILNSTNEGFAKANNKALNLAKGEYLLFLNPDTILAEDTLLQCINFFVKHKNAGAVGVRMIDGSGTFLPESKRAFPSPVVSFYKLIGLAALFPNSRIFNRYALGFLPKNGVHEVDVLSGAFIMVRKNVLDKTGGFDERFFMYAEDIDLSYRILQAGYKNYYLGNIAIIHFKGESTKKESLDYVRMFYRAMRLFVKKYYGGAGVWVVNKGLYAGILFREMVAAFALPFYKKSKDRPLFNTQQIYVAGDVLQVEKAIKIIRKNYPTTGVVSIKDLQEVQFKSGTVVCCTGDKLTYKEGIQFVSNCNRAAQVMWSGKSSCSIAGSSDKNTSGSVLY